MDPSDSHYVHGTEPDEQRRLSRLNAMLNAASLEALALRGDEKILDIGSGLGQFTRMLARKVEPAGGVVGVERNAEQLAGARRQAREDGEEHLLELRRGDAVDLPLAEDEWGTFDIAHARFLLEHVPDPLAVVRSMARAVRPGGRIVLEDDDHDVLRLWPEPPGVPELWRAYFLTYERRGKNPFVGRHLVSLLHEAGAVPRGNRCLNFGSCAGSPNFDAMITNFIAIIEGAREEMASFGLATERQIEEGLAAFREWQQRPDAAMWYTTAWAEGVRAASSTPGARGARAEQPPGAASGRPSTSRDEASLLRFLMSAAAELNSSLELDKVFHKIATGIRPLIDYHLFCVMLWNEQTQLLEHSFSMKYGKAIPQKGGFPLGCGLSGTAAELRRPVRVPNVLEDPRYIRYRHPEVEIHSELAVPLVFQDQLIGALDLESTELDYFTEEHEQMVSALASHIATALVNARLHETVLRDERRLGQELSTAREIQRGLLPRRTPRVAGVEIGAAYAPARELGGDFYDFLRYRDGRLAFAVGDVAGKATPAALLASMAVGLLRGHVVENPCEPAEMLAELNELLGSARVDNRFVAMVYGVYDERTRGLSVASAGFPHPLLVREDRIEKIPAEGMPLGLLPQRRYREETLRVSGGEAVVLCSDGLLESENERGEDFESTVFRSVLRDLAPRAAQEIADGLIRAALDFTGGPARQADDYTVVVLKFA